MSSNGKKTKAVTTTVTGKTLSAQVDRLGAIRTEKLNLEAEEREITKILKECMDAGEAISGQKFEAVLVVPTNRSVNNEPLIKVIGQKKFNEIAKVTIGDLDKILGLEEIDKVVSVSLGSPRIHTKRL